MSHSYLIDQSPSGALTWPSCSLNFSQYRLHNYPHIRTLLLMCSSASYLWSILRPLAHWSSLSHPCFTASLSLSCSRVKIVRSLEKHSHYDWITICRSYSIAYGHLTWPSPCHWSPLHAQPLYITSLIHAAHNESSNHLLTLIAHNMFAYQPRVFKFNLHFFLPPPLFRP